MARLIATVPLGAALLSGCAMKPPHPEAFTFGAMGDIPYNAREEIALDALFGRLGSEPLAFITHAGDFKAGSNAACTDALYKDRRERLNRSPHPLILTPGDNDWADCRRESNGSADPLERLARVREVFFSEAWSLGERRLPVSAQEGCVERAGTGCACPGLPENQLWSKNAVVFATLHVVGSNDNRGFDAKSDAEQRCRSLANLRWLDRAVRLAESPGQRGLVIIAQANLWLSMPQGTYDGLRRQIAEAGRRLGRPMLYIHGDTHLYRLDRPFMDSGGKRVDNLRRIEVPGSPAVGWVRILVDPNRAELFIVEPVLAPEAP